MSCTIYVLNIRTLAYCVHGSSCVHCSRVVVEMPGSPIPIPSFVSCDETSLKVCVVDQQKGGGPKASFPPEGCKLSLQCKDARNPDMDWDSPQVKTIAVDESNEFDGKEVDDLEPGTPYYVRFVLTNPNGTKDYGPETVFDTKPVDCTPKDNGGKKCVIM